MSDQAFASIVIPVIWLFLAVRALWQFDIKPQVGIQSREERELEQMAGKGCLFAIQLSALLFTGMLFTGIILWVVSHSTP